MACSPTERIFVLDSSAFIAGTDSLYSLSGLVDADGQLCDVPERDENVKFYTTADVIAEVKDPNARKRLKLLEGALELRAPSKEALVAVSDFSRTSGDFASLSLTDLRVLALVWMLEFERNGTKFMKPPTNIIEFRKARTIPVHVLEEREEAMRLKEEAEKKERAERGDDEDEWSTVVSKQRSVSKHVVRRAKRKERKLRQEKRMAGQLEPNTCVEEPSDVSGKIEAEVVPEMSRLNLTTDASSENEERMENKVNVSVNFADRKPVSSQTEAVVELGTAVEQAYEIASDDEEGWITAENVEDHLAQDSGQNQEDWTDDVRVGCVTTDFAMQNVLLQMGIKVIATDGRRVIRQVKRFVLRCDACFAIERDVTRKFCQSCGNATLHKVAFKVNKDGIARVFANPHRKPNLRGTKYSIPLPRGGRHNKDLILREDQVDPVKLRRLEKQRAKLNVDVLDPSGFYNAGAKFALLQSQTVIGYGRRNPNESRPGKRR